MTEKKRKSLFPFAMFMGMGVGFLLIERLGGTAFVACMFIGMGIGFLLDALIKLEEEVVKVRLPMRAGGFVLSTIGVLMIIGGILTLTVPDLLANIIYYLIGLGLIAIGLYILFSGMVFFRSSTTS
ncbi:MAG: hypothetical protein J7L11_06000 [Thermoprotei archaeon]|nr:hypothetical protein [Thermoprotei archaeon]